MNPDNVILKELEDFSRRFHESNFLSMVIGEPSPHLEDGEGTNSGDNTGDGDSIVKSTTPPDTSEPTAVSNGHPSYTGEGLSLDVPQVLSDYITHISKTGQTLFPWEKVKPLFMCKLHETMKQFNEEDPLDDLPVIPNCEMAPFDQFHKSVMEAVRTFQQPPFTIQRLCELIVEPKQHYKRIDKFLRGVEKNILVVTTVDSLGNKLCSDDTEGSELERDVVLTSSKPTGLSSMLGWFNKTVSPPLSPTSEVTLTSEVTAEASASLSSDTIAAASTENLQSTSDVKEGDSTEQTEPIPSNELNTETSLDTGADNSPDVGPDASLYTPPETKRVNEQIEESPAKKAKLEMDEETQPSTELKTTEGHVTVSSDEIAGEDNSNSDTLVSGSLLTDEDAVHVSDSLSDIPELEASEIVKEGEVTSAEQTEAANPSPLVTSTEATLSTE